MAVTGLDHINISTTNVEDSRDFFVDVLGFEVGWRPDFPFHGAWLYAQGKDLVHLVEVKTKPAPSHGSALDHFAFAIDDYEDARRRLEAAGIAYEAGEAPNGGIRQFFVTESNGVTFELNCRTPQS